VYKKKAIAVLGHPPAPEAVELFDKIAHELVGSTHMRGALGGTGSLMSKDSFDVRILDTHSTQGSTTKNAVNENLMLAVQGAAQEVVIQSPYFILTHRGLQVLEEAAARGVHISILTNSPVSSDSPITQAAFLKQWPEILQRVKNARLYVVAESRLMHAKVGIIDSTLTFVGSYNLDPLSAGVNGEVLAAIWSPEVAEIERNLIVARIAQGKPRVVEYTLRRDANGEALLDDKGAPIVEFGPDDHCDQEELGKVKRLEPILDLLAPLI